MIIISSWDDLFPAKEIEQHQKIYFQDIKRPKNFSGAALRVTMTLLLRSYNAIF
jgi:hypothetical protein